MAKFYKKMSFDRAREKAMRYCSVQERCEFDVLNRFRAWNVDEKDYDSILDHLIDENFLNQERFVEAFIRGKFRIKSWGKNKIKMGLIAKGAFNEEQFDKVFNAEIEEEEYLGTLFKLIEKKSFLLVEEDVFTKRDKIYRYMLTKGYESELVVSQMNDFGFVDD